MNRHFPKIYIYIHTNGQRVNEKALNITNITGNKIETTVRYRLTRTEMAITKKPKGECCRECGVENTLVHCWCRTLTFAGALPPPGTGDTQGPRHRVRARGAPGPALHLTFSCAAVWARCRQLSFGGFLGHKT